MKQLPSSVRHLQSLLLIDQRFFYTSGGSVKTIASNIRKPLLGATVYSNGLDKLDAASLVFRTLTSALLKQLRSVVVSLLQGIAMLANYKAVSQVTMS